MPKFAVVGISTRTILFPELADGLLLVVMGRTNISLRTGHLVVPDLHGGLLFMRAFDEVCDHALELHEGSLFWWKNHIPEIHDMLEACRASQLGYKMVL